MTPEERNQVTDLFDRLAALEDNPRDREADRLIQDGLRRAPNATYALVQTALIQDEALKRADVRIRELEAQLGVGGEPPRQGGFLENMRDSVFGRRDAPRQGSVPTVRPGGEPMGTPPGYRTEAQPMAQQPMSQQPMAQPSPGGSFLGTAAAAAVGVVGGALLADSIRGMMTGHRGGGQAHAAFEPAGGGGQTPWGGGGAGGDGSLARDLGLNDIGRSSGGGGAPRSQGLMDSDNSNETANETADASASDANYVSDNDPSYAAGDQNDAPEFDDSENDFGGDFGGDDGGGSDE
jgi:uncharacterized protein